VRVSIDYPCFFIKENTELQGSAFWKRLGEATVTDPFPNAIMEIKLSGDVPAWVETIINSGWIKKSDSFSKFQTSMAIHYPSKLAVFPAWMEELDDVSPGVAEAQITSKDTAKTELPIISVGVAINHQQGPNGDPGREMASGYKDLSPLPISVAGAAITQKLTKRKARPPFRFPDVARMPISRLCLALIWCCWPGFCSGFVLPCSNLH